MLKRGTKQPKQARSLETVEAIYLAVSKILEKQGIKGLNTNQIAQVAGVSVGSLYQYFKNKESIFEALLLRMTENNILTFEKLIAEVDPQTITNRDVIRIIVETQFGTIRKMGKLAKYLFQYAPQLLSSDHFKKADDRIVGYIKKKFAEHKMKINSKNPEIALFICVQTVRSVIFMSIVNRKEEEYDLIVEELIQMLTSYIEPQME
jgi:AcrR family transcriptional regulator